MYYQISISKAQEQEPVRFGGNGSILVGVDRIPMETPEYTAATTCLLAGSVAGAAEMIGRWLAESYGAYGPGDEFAAAAQRFGAAMAALADFSDSDAPLSLKTDTGTVVVDAMIHHHDDACIGHSTDGRAIGWYTWDDRAAIWPEGSLVFGFEVVNGRWMKRED